MTILRSSGERTKNSLMVKMSNHSRLIFSFCKISDLQPFLGADKFMNTLQVGGLELWDTWNLAVAVNCIANVIPVVRKKWAILQ